MKALKNWEEKNPNLRWKTEEKKTWIEGAVAGTYMAILPTDSPTEIKNYFYFNLVRRWSIKKPSVIFEFRTKMFNYPPYFSRSVGNSVGKLTRSEMNLMHHPLKFTQSVGIFNGNIGPPTTYWRQLIRRYSHRWLWHFKTDVNPSVWSSIIIIFQVIIFKLSVKCQRTWIHRYCHWWLWNFK